MTHHITKTIDGHTITVTGPDAEELMRRLFTPLTDEQIESMSKTGPVYAPNGVVTRRPIEYRREIQEARAAGIRMAEAAHGIGETK